MGYRLAIGEARTVQLWDVDDSGQQIGAKPLSGHANTSD